MRSYPVRYGCTVQSFVSGNEQGPEFDQAALVARTVLSQRPILIRDTKPAPSDRLSSAENDRLLPTLNARDTALLTALDSYRSLDQGQLEALFVPSSRSTQIRVKELNELGLIQRWKLRQPPSKYHLHSLTLLSARGARSLAASVGADPALHVKRAQDALSHCFNPTHDFEVNRFCVDLAISSRNQGLYHWIGEAQQRILFRDRRLALDALPETGHPVHASIGKPSWWESRPGGGEGG